MSINDYFIEMVNDLDIFKENTISRDDIITWFKKHHPEVKKGTLSCQIILHSTNAHSRIHYGAKQKHDLLFQINREQFRKYNSGNDPQPIYKVSLAGSDKPLQRLSESESVHKGSSRRKDKYEDKVREILTNAEKYHNAFYKAETFRGPSLYFHQRALATRKPPISFTHLEYVYATLASWGMHRMGRGGSKMQSFDTFFQSVEPLNDRIAEAQNFDFHEMTDIKWAVLKEIFQGIKVMASGTTIVGHSKVMHHMLPNVIPPIDREYTLWFLHGNTTIKNNLENEWFLLKEIISEVFIPVASDREFHSNARGWMSRSEDYPWDTSVFKVVDNLVIGSKK